jgi:hypothetical protein
VALCRSASKVLIDVVKSLIELSEDKDRRQKMNEQQ